MRPAKHRIWFTQVKLDEIIRAIGNARNEILDLEELEEADLDRLRPTSQQMARTARQRQASA